MDLRKLKTLIDLVSDSNVSELEITEAEGKVRIVKSSVAPLVMQQPAVATVAAPAAVPAAVAPAPVVLAAPAKVTPPPAPKVFVQFGAFSSAEGAQKAWRELQSRHVSLRDLQPVYRRSGKGATGLHLLKAGVATRADAEKLCRTLQAAGQACLIS